MAWHPKYLTWKVVMYFIMMADLQQIFCLLSLNPRTDPIVVGIFFPKIIPDFYYYQLYHKISNLFWSICISDKQQY